MRAMSGLEACAAVVARTVEAAAIVGGEGARRFEHTLAAITDARAKVLAERGGDAASAAVGMAVAGARVAIVASGRDAMSAALPALRELSALGRAALVVTPAHGDERGRAAPEGPYDDLSLLFEAPVGVLVASGVREVSEVTLAACALASRTASPWCVSFELALTGCAIGAVDEPPREEIAEWWSDDEVDMTAWFNRVDRAWIWIEARRPSLAPVSGRAEAGREAWLRLGGGDFASSYPTVGVRQVRPFPFESVADRCRGAARVDVWEPLADALNPHERGRLTTLVTAALAGSSLRVSQRGWGELADLVNGVARVQIAWNEPARSHITRSLVEFASALGWRVRGETHEPWASSIVLQREGVTAMEPHDVVIAEPGALGLASVIAGVDEDDREVRPGVVVLVGACEGERYEAIRDACERAGATLLHEPEATLAV